MVGGVWFAGDPAPTRGLPAHGPWPRRPLLCRLAVHRTRFVEDFGWGSMRVEAWRCVRCGDWFISKSGRRQRRVSPDKVLALFPRVSGEITPETVAASMGGLPPAERAVAPAGELFAFEDGSLNERPDLGKVTTAAQAREQMLLWANGKLSHCDAFHPSALGWERQAENLAASIEADAAEVRRWAAVYTALLEGERC